MGKAYAFGPFRLDPAARTLLEGSRPVALGQRGFALLSALVERHGSLVGKAELMDAAWPGLAVEESNLTVQVAALRKMLGERGGATSILTVARRGYKFIGKVCETDDKQSFATAGRQPMLAVLPFEDLSGDPEQRYFSDGITHDIITALSRFFGLLVIAANSSFRYRADDDLTRIEAELGVRYVLQGSVRRSGNRIRIAVQLVEIASGAHRWADRYDLEIGELFAVQDAVTERIVGVLVAHVTKVEEERALRKAPADWQAYDYYLRALHEARIWDRPAFSSGMAMLERAIALDPGFAPAYAELAQHHVSAWCEPKDRRFSEPTTLHRAEALAGAALERDPLLPAAHAAEGHVLLWRHRPERAVASYERALALNPSFADGRFGPVLTIAGRAADALVFLGRVMRMDPFFRPMLLAWMGHAHLMLDENEAAVERLRECAARAPGWRPAHVWLAAACARLGRRDEARAAASAVLAIHPGFSIAGWRAMHAYRDTTAAERLYASLAAAGLPELPQPQSRRRGASRSVEIGLS
jgi:TolB-like protein/lipopolysaccharide biosynthesis regulator YciM